MTTVDDMEKADGAFLTIGELAQQLGVAQHILRYWESRFPQLRPLQRAGNRRYYRPQDVAVAQHIHRLLNVEGFTIKGAAKVLGASGADRSVNGAGLVAAPPPPSPSASLPAQDLLAAADVIDRLQAIREALSDALETEPGHSS